MGFFGEMFGGGRGHEGSTNKPTPEQNNNELRKVTTDERIHRDFHYAKNDWHFNDLLIVQEKEDTLPGLSFDYIIDDETITELFEDFPFPTKIRKQNDGRYFCTTFVDEKGAINLDDILYKKDIEIISKPDLLNEESNSAA